ncbi:DUF6479 family protein [Actinoallomurus sp. NPDC052274]|uniref:DUF6479 family protein n=1 Tax=Actinoallomurus sp. NPDC052274 TaxID=3155420 RepID=UPI0034443EC1
MNGVVNAAVSGAGTPLATHSAVTAIPFFVPTIVVVAIIVVVVWRDRRRHPGEDDHRPHPGGDDGRPHPGEDDRRPRSGEDEAPGSGTGRDGPSAR